MQTIVKADVFFFVATIAMVLVSCTVVIVLIRISQALRTLTEFLEHLKTQTQNIGDEAGEILERIQTSFIFNVFFPKKVDRKKKEKRKL